MVEDEFFLIAQRFTTHLHRAEYNRLKALAKSQNAATIRQIERPVVGPPTSVAKRRHEAISRATKQRDVLERTQGSGDVDDPAIPGMGAGLRGLMESPKKEAKTIRSFGVAAARTKAAAQYGPRGGSSTREPGSHVSDSRANVSRLRDEADEEAADDLGAHTPRGSTSRLPVSSTVSARSSTLPKKTPTTQTSRTLFRPKSEPNLKRSSSRQDPAGNSIKSDDDDDEDDMFGIRKRQIRRAKSREQFHKASEKRQRDKSPDSIPTFL